MILLGLLLPVCGVAQSDGAEPSLGDLARSLRKGKPAPEHTVIDNDNLHKVMDEVQNLKLKGSRFSASTEQARSSRCHCRSLCVRERACPCAGIEPGRPSEGSAPSDWAIHKSEQESQQDHSEQQTIRVMNFDGDRFPTIVSAESSATPLTSPSIQLITRSSAPLEYQIEWFTETRS